VMVQPYFATVEDPGEISLIFIGGRYSHAMRKGATFELGAGVYDRPWERICWLGVTKPSEAELRAARGAILAMHRRFHHALAYARVDLIAGTDGSPLVLEVEAIDPVLSFVDYPDGAVHLAEVVARQCR
jgi:hypothetical protein